MQCAYFSCYHLSSRLTFLTWMQCTIATQMDPDTHCAAIVISTSDDPQARQLSTIVTNSALILDVLKSGEFSVKKITRVASDAIRYVLLSSFLFNLLTGRLRGRAAELSAVNFKKGGRGNALAQLGAQNHFGGQQKSNIKLNKATYHGSPIVNLPPQSPQLQPSLPNMLVPQVVSVSGNILNIGGVELNPENITREQFQAAVARHFLCQAIDANADAVERKTFPFKRFVQFAFKYQLTLVGWPIDICPSFPGDAGFDVDKVQRHQWRKIWDAVFENKTLQVRRWLSGLLFFVILLWCLLINHMVNRGMAKAK